MALSLFLLALSSNRVSNAVPSQENQPSVLSIADSQERCNNSLPENTELNAAGILCRSADSREIVDRPSDHTVDIDA